MTSVGYATLDVIPSLKGMEKNLESGMAAPTARVGKRSGERFGKVFARGYLGPLKGIGAAALGFIAVDKVTGFIKDSVAEAREAQKVTALTAAVIKSTGGAANVTAKQVGKLSTAISNKTGIDDETIQSGENMLLTFKNIRNEVGKGNDIFDQSTRTLVDLSAAMGTEPKQAAIQLGKALNDPIKGITALTRVGVTFDDQQKKTIKHLVNTGHTMEAQKIILKELNSEFGGAAKASTTAGEKAAVAWANLKEQIGTALLPVIDDVEKKLTKDVIPAVSKFIRQFQRGKGTGGAVRRDLEQIWEAGKKVVKIGEDVVKAFDGLPDGLKKAIALGGVSAFVATKIPGVRSLGKGTAGVAGKFLGGGVQKVFVVNEGFGKDGVGGKAGGGSTLKTIAATAASFVIRQVVTKSPYLLPLLTKGDSAPQRGGMPSHRQSQALVGLDKNFPGKVGLDIDKALAGLFKKDPSKGFRLISNAARDAGTDVGKFTSLVGKRFPETGDQINRAGGSMKEFQHRSQATKDAISRLTGDLTGTTKALNRSGLSVRSFTGKLRSLPKGVQTRVTTPGAIKSRADITELTRKYHLTPKQVRTLLQLTGVGKVNADINRTKGNLDSYGRKHPRATVSIDGVASSIRQVDALNYKLGNIHDQKATITTYYKSLGKPKAGGGTVWGPGTGTSDSILTPLSNGEEVINARQAAKHRSLLKAINAGAQGFAGGGTVGGGSGSWGNMPSTLTVVIDGQEFSAYFEEAYDAQKQLTG